MTNAQGLAYATPRGQAYEVYINSPEWGKKRAEYWEHAGRSCKVRDCGSTEELQVHHHTYERLGNERLSDLVGVCKVHHQEIHARHDVTGRRRSLTRVTEEVTGIRLREKVEKGRPSSRGSRKKAAAQRKTLAGLEELHRTHPSQQHKCQCRTCKDKGKKVGKAVSILDTVSSRERVRLNNARVFAEAPARKQKVLKKTAAARKADARQKVMNHRAAVTRAHQQAQEVARRIAATRQK